ncbi:Kelch repeat-containing protein [Pseudoteredinibacter isoporae]|uniref:N-acetylneuraminic acid mutarotase n=1 Tax=Pseudoteredinibacter isoporae TaxID=570281 RepID=A0A7X0JTM7_9GAMM|nr:kelch repeat-containing protein [Pseudoteredinibacter isoporae]MBB6522039.1 N-acetylneuraminic acid mutarotase [Pseudoteredinibacter isoporae]NHO87575.1 hypothetical protein [Pseudoteredinibacter isoporae]NIB24094.1 hypothetical protein [Pseudoteredinibacter isoporae]
MDRRNFLIASGASLLSIHPLISSAAKSAPQWSSGPAPIPINIQEIYPTVHKNRLYVAGGIASKFGVPYFSNACYSFDPASNQWREEAKLPKAMHHATLVSNGERLFLFGGFHGGYSHIWRMQDAVYELLADGWTQIDTLPKPLAEGVLSCAPDGTIHWVTGQSPRSEANSARSDHQEITDHYRWLPDSQEWQTLAPIPTPRNSATGAWLGDQLIVTGGRTAKGNLSHTEIYDSKSAQWREAAPLPLPQAGTASVVVDDGLIVFGGEIFIPQAKVFKEVWRYSLSQDRWTSLPDMLTPRHGLGAGRFGKDIYVIGGATGPSGDGTSPINERFTL